MKLRILTVGKPKLDYAKYGFEEYLSRLSSFGNIQWQHVKASNQSEESKRLLEASEGSYRIVLDERGKKISTQQMFQALELLELSAVQSVCLLIGGADGHAPNVHSVSRECWSLSSLTLQHELATLVLLEQIYRVFTMKKGLPYHRPSL